MTIITQPSPCSCCSDSQASSDRLETTPGRPNHTGLRAIKSDLRSLNTMHGRRHLLENTGDRLWTRYRLRSRRVCRERRSVRYSPQMAHSSLSNSDSPEGATELFDLSRRTLHRASYKMPSAVWANLHWSSFPRNFPAANVTAEVTRKLLSRNLALYGVETCRPVCPSVISSKLLNLGLPWNNHRSHPRW